MIITWLNLYYIFFKIGLFSFGGGYVMLPLIYQSVELHNLLPLAEFADVVALSQMTPGPIAVNAATYIGYRNAGLIGSVFATLGVISPSMILVFVILKVMKHFENNPLTQAILDGVKPVTVGMIAVASLYFLERSVFRGKLISSDLWEMQLSFVNLPAILIFLFVIILVTKTKINPLILTLVSGFIAVFIF